MLLYLFLFLLYHGRVSRQRKREEITQILQRRGILSAGELVRELGVARSTLARKLAGMASSVIAIGKTRNLHYGHLRSLNGLESRQPLFRVNPAGQLVPVGALSVLYGGHSVVEPLGQIFEALPPEVFDMAPQGFMGRSFATQFAAPLELSPRLGDWSDDHILKALVCRGEDMPGNVIVGQESAVRWQSLHPVNVKVSAFVKLAKQAFNEQPAGSSAGGEQSKFLALVDGEHKLLKFCGPLYQPAQRRWADLLHCEAIAGHVLQKAGLPVVQSKILKMGDFVFLEVTRFDRVGSKGRRPYLSLSAVDGFLFGDRDTWSAAAMRLERRGLITQSDLQKIKLIDAFAQLIGDSDRHFHNLGLLPHFHTESSFIPQSYELAPVFDKLPMLFAPVEGRLLQRDFKLPQPHANLVDVWQEALHLATVFWNKVTLAKNISAAFRRMAKNCLKHTLTPPH